MKTFTISGISFMPQLWKPEKNLDTLLGYIDKAAQAGAQIIATPEGVLDGYITKDLKKEQHSRA
jgi:predicted amidohydrolase